MPGQSRHAHVRKLRRCLLGVLLALAVLPAGTASAGRLVATGHDADDHCSFNEPQCQFFRTAVAYVRAGAPDPGRPVLVFACTDKVERALTNAFGAGAVAATRMCPTTDPGFASAPINTSTYSALIVGSTSDSINTTGSPADSQAIEGRKNDIAAFFNAGGGIFALAGDQFGDGDPANGVDAYYNFIPLPAVGKKVVSPFRLTAEGQGLGFEDQANGIGAANAINCCPTHNSFQEPPSGSALKVAERDSSVPPAPETLFADGQISGGGIVPPGTSPTPPAFGPGGVVVAPSNKRCVSRRKFRIRLRQPRRAKLVGATVKVNGRTVATRRGRRVTAPVDLRGLPRGRFTVSITILLDDGRIIRGTRRYRTCEKKRLGRRPPPV